MKAAIYTSPGKPEVLHIADVADPVPADNELLIRVEAISIEGGDLVNRREFPQEDHAVIGYSAAGEIVQIGKDVSGFSLGQKVTTFSWKGSHAELRAVPAGNCFVVPDGLDLGVAATIPVSAGTAAWVLELGALKAGQTVLVLGASGGVGVAAVQLAAKKGARVIGTGTRAESLEKLREYGLSDAIVTADKTAHEQVRALLDGKGVDLIIDNVGGDVLNDALQALNEGGRAVLVGVFGGRKTQIDAGQLLMRRQTVIGCLLGPIMGEPEPRKLIEELLNQALNGELNVPIDATFAFADVAEAHRRAEERGRIGRVVMTL
ncbi:SDR family NAD(P)-dependent oxidoreductase [Erwinia billingiae]|jgi:NADPH2:quinone reductase|uniref:quinone oxidoreductase family protein n=1 Tax=Erwinia billingiae TaxID=182337 RepID=UPI001248DED2|nr:SDR family NAD(P)-dependent oxidoreductase [Erwinia billingiae]QEW32288.1 SDR family NAD(P)-dependent oxidoreductase [Erwinia billingiae]